MNKATVAPRKLFGVTCNSKSYGILPQTPFQFMILKAIQDDFYRITRQVMKSHHFPIDVNSYVRAGVFRNSTYFI